MSKLCIIPARAGSKRVPGKNVREFLGKPILVYPLEAAQQTGLFDELMVSTDDQAIADLAKKHGAQVPFLRSKEASDDYAGLSTVIEEVVERYESELQRRFESVCCILPTAVLITPTLIKTGYEMLSKGVYDSVRPIQSFPFPIQRAYVKRGEFLDYLDPESASKRSQDLEETYHDAGMFYWIKTDRLKENHRWGGLLISQLESVDIDTEEDWKVAEFKYKLRHSH